MKTVTLRLPEDSYRKLVELCRQHGLTCRGIFEATTIISIRDLEDPARRDDTLLLWEAARALDESPDFPGPSPRRVNAKLDDDIAELLAKTCHRFGVSQNAALGLVTMAPWPMPETLEFKAFRRCNWARIVELARQREFDRRPYALT